MSIAIGSMLGQLLQAINPELVGRYRGGLYTVFPRAVFRRTCTGDRRTRGWCFVEMVNYPMIVRGKVEYKLMDMYIDSTIYTAIQHHPDRDNIIKLFRRLHIADQRCKFFFVSDEDDAP